ncbi:hypothetical protein [Microbispora sp. NBRC 16548]|uniref:hypothetical protein n=1 Tax=Microbispora sp. NBRC 16548 TaxID=3030994 RepID=UPI00249FD88B|nr:hypothetical protein [Microbispora sp. NBRC 16548]GLX05761.1 hypothetical protein Misp03_26880 [Microbispora sp. NBRC 16548]
MATADAGKSAEITWGREKLVISSLLGELPPAPSLEAHARMMQAAVGHGLVSVSEQSWEAVARACVRPDVVALQLEQAQGAGLLLEEHVDGATLRSVHSRMWMTELFPGIQPRTGQEALDVPDPQVFGVAKDGKPQAVIRYRYRDLAHFQQHVWQTISVTLHLNSYEESILSRRVTRALIAHPVLIEFEDGSESLHVIATRDGITRLASAWKVLAGPSATPTDAADLAVEVLFGESGTSLGTSRSDRMNRSRAAYRERLRQEHHRESKGGGLSLRMAQIAQTYLMPVHLTIGVEAHTSGALAPEDVFDDAVRSILASVHVEFKPWDDSAQNLEVVTRALKLFAQSRRSALGDQEQLRDIYSLAIGRTNEAATPRVYGDERIPGTPLWRATCLLHTLTRPEFHEQLKARAKEIKNERRMSTKGYAGLLGPVIDLPWRAAKSSAMKPARNAWSNGGVLCEDVLADGWVPVPTADFLSLVEPALAGDVNARCTLAVAGGVALIADKLLTRNVGSAVAVTPAPGKVPFRADVSTVIGGLARKDNELGLWILAHAAQRFRHDLLPRNASSARQMGLRDAATGDDAYVHVAVDLEAPDRILREDEREVALTTWDVVFASDPERARRMTARAEPPQESRPSASSGTDDEAADSPTDSTTVFVPTEMSTGQLIVEERKRLHDWLSYAKRSLETLEELGSRVSFPPLLGSPEEWLDLQQSAFDVLEFVQRNRSGGPEDEEEEQD